MRRTLLKHASLCTRTLLSPSAIKLNPSPIPIGSSASASSAFKFRFFSSENDSAENSKSPEETNLAQTKKEEVPIDVSDVSNKENSKSPEVTTLAQLKKEGVSIDVADVSNKELKMQIEKYFKGDEEVLPEIFEAILARKLAGKHEDTDDELMDELRFQPLDNVKDTEFESDFEDAHETDEEIDDLCNARELVTSRMADDECFNMDDKKWDDMIKEATEKGFLKDAGECERILEDMLSWDKLLPDEIKQKVEQKFNELGDMCERGELEPEEAYGLFKEFEDKMVMECIQMMEEDEGPLQLEIPESDKNVHLDDPPGEGPILRWQTRVVIGPGGDAWHPKNRRVKMSVTVKELGLSKYQFRRLREIVGKRYHPGRDELTITSERFEHREENRKDCLRTLYSLLEEAGKADKLVEDGRASYVKDKLKANPAFMERLRAKTMKLKGSNSAAA